MLLDDKFEYLLRLGDNALILSQRLSQWCGKGPAFEEDMALTNTALDLIGQARMWLSYAGEVEDRGRDEDALAFLRDAHQFRNLLLLEQPNGDYAVTIARQFYFDTWHCLLLQELNKSADSRIAEIAEKALKEVRYHLRRSSDLVVRLGDGTAESQRRMQAALDDLWMYTGEMLTPDEQDELLAAQNIVPDPAILREPWLQHVGSVLHETKLTMPTGTWMQKGGKLGRHTEHLGYVLAEMQFLQRAYPGAKW
ncbi:MAG: 1,2-phenylacetyl-CoA epoxidase subunit PaaC [Burkholderiales bacterium]